MTRMYLPGPAGRLEALLLEPPQALAAALLCHPHPQHGGTMHTKVVYRAARGLGEAGCSVLRFHFRGVGNSDGSWDNERGERLDADAAFAWLARERPQLPLITGGFSFGSFMGLQAGLRHPRTRALIALGPPLDRYRFEFLEDNRLPLLVVAGGDDPFCPRDDLEHSARNWGPQVELHVPPGDGHLLLRELETVQRLVSAFAARILARNGT